MRRSGQKRVGLSSRLLLGSCLVSGASLGLLSTQALAQAPGGAAAVESPTRDSETIVVSGTRIKSADFEAPTPVLAIDTELLERRGTTNVADIINELPAVRSFTTPASTGQSSNVAGENTISLRGLGFQSTLILLDGRRVVPQKAEGRVNLNAIPQALIKKIDVVTGGASAAWGSDAVAGVVNLILDRDIEGLRGTLQFGISDKGDGEQYRLSLAAGGGFADGRGHIAVGADYQKNPDNVRCRDRGWCARQTQLIPNTANTSATDGIPALVTRSGVTSILGVDNGAIVGGPAAIANTVFGPNGFFGPFNRGQGVAGLFVVNGGGSDFAGRTVIQLPYERQSLMALADYDITDHVTVFVDAWFARTKTVSPTIVPANGLAGGTLIRSGNPFLPAAFQQILTTNNIPSFTLMRSNLDLGEITADIRTETWSGTAGFRGDIGENWKWEAYYQYGRSSALLANRNNLITANFNRAADVVNNNGTPACRSAVDGTDPKCVPINLFGLGSPSAAARAYVLGTAFNDVWNSQQVAAANISGQIAEGWAGPILSAFGVEYRKEKAGGVADPISQSAGFLIANLTPDRGKFDVKEGFAEIDVPLLKDSAVGHSLSFNGAARYTSYSTIGDVVTWKLGAIYEPISDIRLRGTWSRDIRAPGIRELFSGRRQQFANLADPFRGGATALAQVTLGGNPDLQEERATTKALGLVLQPSGWARGFNASIDYYDINIKNAITTPSAASVVAGCFAGSAVLCSQITRNAAGVITAIDSTTINAARIQTSGVDVVARYLTTNLLPGRLDFSLTANYVDRFRISTNGVTFVDRAGEVGLNAGAGSEAPTPHWRVTGGIGYEQGPAGGFMQVRYVGGGTYDNSWTIENIDRNRYKGRAYFDLSGRVKLTDHFEFFGGVNNLFDKAPPIIPATFPGQPATNTVLYDTMGRFLYAGIRANL